MHHLGYEGVRKIGSNTIVAVLVLENSLWLYGSRGRKWYLWCTTVIPKYFIVIAWKKNQKKKKFYYVQILFEGTQYYIYIYIMPYVKRSNDIITWITYMGYQYIDKCKQWLFILYAVRKAWNIEKKKKMLRLAI